MTNNLAGDRSHPFVNQKGLMASCESTGENFAKEFGSSLFGSLAELGSLIPWNFFTTDYPVQITIKHSKFSENKKRNTILILPVV